MAGVSDDLGGDAVITRVEETTVNGRTVSGRAATQLRISIGSAAAGLAALFAWMGDDLTAFTLLTS